MSAPSSNPTPIDVSSPESDSNKSTTAVKPKRRASRAGARTVGNLSQAQLEKKRLNDREAQRAIRARTKDRIESLEKRILELTTQPYQNDQLVAALERSKELEEENSILRARLEAAGVPIPNERTGSWVASSASMSPQQHADLSMQQSEPTSPVSARHSQDQGNLYTYSHSTQWQTGSSIREELPVKSEEPPSPGSHLAQEFSTWSVGRSHPQRLAGRAEIPQPMEYFTSPGYAGQQIGSAGQEGVSLPMQSAGLAQYAPIHQQYMAHQQQQLQEQRRQEEQQQRQEQQQQHQRRVSGQDLARKHRDPSSHGSQELYYSNFPAQP